MIINYANHNAATPYNQMDQQRHAVYGLRRRGNFINDVIELMVSRKKMKAGIMRSD